jgi:hypothetical protein
MPVARTHAAQHEEQRKQHYSQKSARKIASHWVKRTTHHYTHDTQRRAGRP